MNPNRWPKPLFLFPGAVALIFGLLAGLQRLGIDLPAPVPDLFLKHGPLMVAGFLATVIGLERAVALGAGWSYLAPGCSGLGALLFLAGFTQAPLLMALGGLFLAATAVEGLRRHFALYAAVMALGALMGALGSLAWALGLAIPSCIAAWMAFLALTIAGERLELTRFLPPAKGRTSSLVLLTGLILLAALGGLAGLLQAPRFLGLGFLGLAVWFLRFDIARRNLLQRGLSRFIGLCLASGYVWLGIGGFALLYHGMPESGFEYDAVLHIVFIGFVFSMIFGHGPVILPAILKRQAPYHPILLAWLVLLQGGLVLRLIGDHNEIAWLRQTGGVLNEAAILLYILTLAVRTVQSTRTGAEKT
jgi:hypothetical protein